MMGNDDAIEYLTCNIPDMLGELDVETTDEYQRCIDRIKYLVKLSKGIKPKYHKGMRALHDYWTCGNCGRTIMRDVGSKYCDLCGARILWES